MAKRMRILLASVMLSMVFAVTAYAGWQQDEKGYWYQYDNGSYAANGIKEIEGKRYAFGPDGYMLTGWQYLDFRWYYFEPGSGEQASGWKMVGDKWYYLDPKNDNEMYIYWLDLGKDRYYLDEQGVLQTGIFYLSNNITGSMYAYQADANGALFRNMTVENDGRKIKYDNDGIMMYRNSTTERYAKITGEEPWQYLLNDTEMERQKLEQESVINDTVRKLKAQLYEDYRDKVRYGKGSKKEENTQSWERRAERDLGFYVSEEELAAYITSVKNGSRYTYYETEKKEEEEEEYDFWEESWSY